MPDGSFAVAKDTVIKFYNSSKNELEKALTGHVKTILALQPLPDGNLISAGLLFFPINFTLLDWILIQIFKY